MLAKTTIFILGSGGFAHELHDYMDNSLRRNNLSRLNRSKFLNSEFFFVDDYNPDVLSVAEYQKRVASLKECYSIMGSGKCDVKLKMKSEIVGEIISFIHPKSINMGKVEKGCVIAPGVVIAPRAMIKEHALCNYNCTIGHDAIIGDYSVIAPQASVGGYCILGQSVYIGANACIRENIRIGDGATIGMGAIVTKDVPAGATIINVNERLN